MMFGETVPLENFKVHDWRNGIVRKGEVPSEMLSGLSGGKVDYSVSGEVNITLLDREPKKVVVYLDPHEFQSTWLGNKSVYRTRMAIADGGASDSRIV